MNVWLCLLIIVEGVRVIGSCEVEEQHWRKKKRTRHPNMHVWC